MTPGVRQPRRPERVGILAGLGWRRIQPGAPDGVTNMLAVLTEAVAKNLPVTVCVDGNFVYQAYL